MTVKNKDIAHKVKNISLRPFIPLNSDFFVVSGPQEQVSSSHSGALQESRFRPRNRYFPGVWKLNDLCGAWNPMLFVFCFMRCILLLLIPFLLPGQNTRQESLYAHYQKSRPAYKKRTEKVFFSKTDTLILSKENEETWEPEKYRVVYQAFLEKEDVVKQEYQFSYSLSDPDKVRGIYWYGGKAQDTTFETRTGDTSRTLNTRNQLVEMKVFNPKDSSSSVFHFNQGSVSRTVTIAEKGKKQELQYLSDSLQMRTVYYGKEPLYDSVVSYDKKGLLFVKTSYSYNVQGDVAEELEYHPRGDGPARWYKTSYVYVYDGRNNWIEKTVSRRNISEKTPSPGSLAPRDLIWVYKRVIDY
jgi:hypothetical protein